MILLLAILAQALGFYGLYNTSDRAFLAADRISLCLQKNKKLSNVFGWGLLIVSMVMFYLCMGLGAGFLTGTVLFMTIGSLQIILTPLLIRTRTNARQ